MSNFWADRAPLPSETGAHLARPVDATELAISHITYAVAALAPLSLSEQDRVRVMGLVEKLTREIGE